MERKNLIGYWGEVRKVEWEADDAQLVRVYLTFRKREVTAFYFRYAGSRVKVGQTVLVNTSGVDLELGTGGYGFIMAIEPEIGTLEHDIEKQDGTKRSILDEDSPYLGRIIKWRYTPQQTAVKTVECEESVYHPLFCEPFHLNQRLVMLGELHSMFVIVAALLFHWCPKRRVAYIMDDQAALHLGISHQIRQLKKKGDLVTITIGQAIGGDLEAVNLYTALEAAVKVARADDIVISQGPGVVGTSTPRGFSGMQLAQWIHAVTTLQGVPVVIPRLSWADRRPRHRGLSEHTRYPLAEHVLSRVQIPYPVEDESIDQDQESLLQKQLFSLRSKHDLIPIPTSLFKEELKQALAWYGDITTMGRTYAEDPLFFEGVGAAFYYYRQHLKD